MEDFFYPKLKKFHGLDCPKIERRMTIKSLQRPKRPALSHRLVWYTYLFFKGPSKSPPSPHRVDIIEGHGQFLMRQKRKRSRKKMFENLYR